MIYTATCLRCPVGMVRFAAEDERREWLDGHRGHATMVGEAPGDPEPVPRPIATVKHGDVGNPESPDWRLTAAIASRTRAARLENAQWCLAHEHLFSAEQMALVRGIIDGSGDGIMQKEIEHGYEPA